MANIYDFFGLIKQAVKHYPEGDLRPNTFLVESKELDVHFSEPNLGATICDKDKNYFYSRLWEQKKYPTAVEFDWPLVSCFFGDTKIGKTFSLKPSLTYDFFIKVTDVYKGDSENCKCGTLAGRSPNEIHADTKRILFGILRFIGNSGIYLVDGVEKLLSNDEAAQYDYTFVRGIESMLPQTEATMYHTYLGENRYGTQIKFSVKFSECNTNLFSFNCDSCG